MRFSIILPAFAAVAALAQSGIAPAAANSTNAIVPTGSAGNGSSSTNGTVNTASLKSTKTSSTVSPSSSITHSSSGTSSTSGSGSTTTSSGSTTSPSKAAADIVQPILGLGFAGVIFAAFL